MTIKTQAKATVRFTCDLTLTEEQARALEALVGYGTDEFLKAFYRDMGKHYLQPYERGLRELFDEIDKQVRPALCKVDRLRRVLRDTEKS